MRTTLLTAVRTVVLADSHPVRQALFARLRLTSRLVRTAEWLHARLGRGTASSLLVATYGAWPWLTIAGVGKGSHLVSLAIHAGARRRVGDITRAYGERDVFPLRTRVTALLQPAGLARLVRLAVPTRQARHTFSLIRLVNERHGFLVACRVASLLGWHARSKAILAASRPLGVLVSSDSNPEEVGLVAAARSLSIPAVFVSHAYTTPVSPRLNFSLSILEGQASRDAHSRKGPIQGTVVLAGVEGASAPMDPARLLRPQPIVGIFAPKVVAWPVLASVIDDCRKHLGARQVVIRWHPSMIGRSHLQAHIADTSNVVETSGTETLEEVVDRCDWIVADPGSNVHLQVLKLGVPTVSVWRLGFLSDEDADLSGFVANRVTFPPVTRLSALPLAEAKEFYAGDWVSRFRKYDAGHLQPEAQVTARVVGAIRKVIAER